MSKNQWLFIGVFVALLLLTFFGLKLTPPNWGSVEKIRSLNAEVINIDQQEQTALDEINPTDANMLRLIKEEIASAANDLERIDAMKSISSNWYRLGYPHLSAHYAEQIAQIENTDQSWSIAGTSYLLAMQASDDQKIKQYSSEHARSSLDNAKSLDPENIDYQINRALVDVEMPPADNPMTGVLQLVQLNKAYPENINVLNQLGRLALRTNQLEKAASRFESVLSLQPDNSTATCQLATVYQNMGRTSEAQSMSQKCKSLINK